MKILAIRGENLASLQAAFAIDLSDGPLARAGVFAICGPTGAGKSTLLDAMCLALFDTAPRLDGKGRGRVGRDEDDDADRLTLSDPRSLLRKGSGHGFAEVDFEGVDGRRYRARWEVRRARGRPEGKLQPTAMSLLDIDREQPIGAKKTDVRSAIEQRLGLSFDQFRRSVLLAQGDFAAFLDADPKDRADLLERMTGTEIYGLISKEAHERVSRERAELDRLGERLRMVQVMSPEERALAEGRAPGLTIRVAEDELAAKRAAAAVRWHAQLAALRREEREALDEKARIEGQLGLAETRRKELAAVEAAWPLRPFVESADRARQAADVRRVALEAARRELGPAASEEARAVERAKVAEQSAAAAEAELERLRPELERARALDRELEKIAPRRAEAQHALNAAETDRDRCHEERTALEARAAAHQIEAKAQRAWLEAHPIAARLAEAWGWAEPRLDELCDVVSELAGLEPALAAARDAHAEAVVAHAEREGRARGFAWRRAEAEREQAELVASVRAEPSSALESVRQEWAAERTALETLIGLAEKAQSAHEAQVRQLERAERADDAARSAEAEAAAAGTARSSLAARLDEASHQRDRLRATLDLTARRAELVEGEPCPLCGSDAHPFAHEAPAVSALLEDADARLAALRDDLSRCDATVAAATGAAEGQRASASEARADAQKWETQLADARERYRRTAASLERADGAWPAELSDTPVDLAAPTPDWGPLFELAAVAPAPSGAVLSDAAQQALVTAREEAERKLEQLEEQARDRRRNERHAERARARFEAARDEHDAARAAVAVAERDTLGLERDRAEREREVERLRALRLRRATELAEVLAPFSSVESTDGRGWEDGLASDPARFLDEVRAAVAAWQAASDALKSALEAERALAPALVEATERLRAAEVLATRAGAAASTLEAERAELRRERASLLDGVDAQQVERRTAVALDAARTEGRRAQAALVEAQRTHALKRAAADRAESAAAEADAEQRAMAERLTGALEDAGLEEAEVRARLAIDPADMEGVRKELGELDAARSDQQAVCTERTRKRQAHEETDAPVLDAEAADRAMGSAERRAAETRDVLAALRQRLAQDDAERARAEQIRGELEAHRAKLAVWETLSDLIGSSSGTKLRVFAQSLTLEMLLEHANHHLRELAPRYGLERVPGEDLALQVVDHEMGDEVRAVGSLSGGESFLVALGMALGLASLSAQRARVDSLFIDEGFGALDPGSLEMVLSTLDALQASGRQVGLISHVPTIAERFDTRIQVVPAGPARSRVELLEGF